MIESPSLPLLLSNLSRHWHKPLSQIDLLSERLLFSALFEFTRLAEKRPSHLRTEGGVRPAPPPHRSPFTSTSPNRPASCPPLQQRLIPRQLSALSSSIKASVAQPDIPVTSAGQEHHGAPPAMRLYRGQSSGLLAGGPLGPTSPPQTDVVPLREIVMWFGQALLVKRVIICD